MTHDLRLQITVGGHKVEGEIAFLALNDIQVRITHPFEEVSTGLHIPYFALPLRRYEQAGVITRHGWDTAHKLLAELYQACCFCAANEEALLRQCRIILDENPGILCELSDLGFLPRNLPIAVGDLVWQTRSAIRDRWGRWLPDDLVRDLLSRVD